MLLEHFLHTSILFQLTFVAYALAFLIYTIAVFKRSPKGLRLALFALAAAFVLNTAIIGFRWMEAGRAPFKTLYETMLFYPWCVSLVYFVLWMLYRVDVLGPFAGLINVVGFFYAGYKPDIEIINLPPALQSGWFVPHVVTYFIAYAALFASFSLSVLYLKFPAWHKNGLGFEEMQKQALDFGFVALTFGLVMGSFWGKVAWGNYWAWDPKENWALITWFVYLIAIHLRFIRDWKGKRAAVLNIVGFAAVIFTYLGMSLLPTANASLHVYQ